MFIYGTQIYKILVVFALPVRELIKLVFYDMRMISFKVINKHCLNLIQRACVMVVIIRTKTQRIMLEPTILSQVVYNQGM